MSNPIPRPALRKAPDADIHPAIADPAHVTVDLRSQPAVSMPAVSMPAVSMPAPPTVDTGRTGAKGKVTKQADSKQSKSNAARRKGKRIELHVRVPRTVRSQLRATAKARGTSVDDVVSTVLQGWLNK